MGKKIDLTGLRFGHLVVLRELQERRKNQILWECLCDCGATSTPSGNALRNGLAKSCGCRGSVVRVGARFGRLKVLSIESRKNKGVLCQCDCGTVQKYAGGNLKSGTSRSCGCLQRELLVKRSTTHGMTNTPTFKSWSSMVERCSMKSHISYQYYGARGVEVCERWNPAKGGTFENFYADMGERPKGKTLDKDIKGGVGCLLYSPENCCWATATEQARHRRSNVLVELNGERMTVAEASELTNINASSLYKRRAKGLISWTVQARQ